MSRSTHVSIPQLSDFSEEERSPALKLLLGICHSQHELIVSLENKLEVQSEQLALQSEQIQLLKDEISVLKGEKGRPAIKPSSLTKSKPGNEEKKRKQAW